jgi:sec-independent protein translocase protein TatC
VTHRHAAGVLLMVARTSQQHEYPDDIFADTRMTFGEHIEELRARLIKAIFALLVCLVIGFILDGIGTTIGEPNFGVGKPMLDVITEPVETQVSDFYNRRNERIANQKLAELANTTPDEIERIKQKLKDNDYALSALTADERRILLGQTEKLPVILPVEPLAKALGIPPQNVAQKEIQLDAQVLPAQLSYLSDKGASYIGSKKYITTLSAQEAFVVYFKVSLICGIVIASPIILYQFWAFIGAGLYPHEKRLVGVFFWPSVILFIGGVLLCQFLVLPGTVKALLKFNEWLGFDPDIRLNEWLGLAIILPLVFGLSFQTPLVMIFLNRIGMFTAADYLSKWRYACFVLALFAALVTPTPDIITMAYLFTPMFGLYLAGIVFCHFFPGIREEDLEEESAEEIAV